MSDDPRLERAGRAAVDVESGELKWRAQGRPETVLQWVDPAVFPELVVFMDVPRLVTSQDTTTTSHLIAFDRTTGEQVWTTDLDDPTEGFSDRLLASDRDRAILIAATPAGEVTKDGVRSSGGEFSLARGAF